MRHLSKVACIEHVHYFCVRHSTFDKVLIVWPPSSIFDMRHFAFREMFIYFIVLNSPEQCSYQNLNPTNNIDLKTWKCQEWHNFSDCIFYSSMLYLYVYLYLQKWVAKRMQQCRIRHSTMSHVNRIYCFKRANQAADCYQPLCFKGNLLFWFCFVDLKY